MLDDNQIMVGITGSLRLAYERAIEAANCDALFSILGEKGTGKETMARWVASRSDRRAEPFVLLRCDLLFVESWFNVSLSRERFVERIAETVGRGCLYLKEIETLSESAQRFLTSFLHTKILFPKELPCRLILGSSVPFRDARERLCPELRDALASFPIALPPLCDRGREEFDLLARSLYNVVSREVGVLPRELTEGELDSLRSLTFSDNIDGLARALRNMLEKEYHLTETRDSTSQDALLVPAPTKKENFETKEQRNKLPTLEEIVIQHIERALTISRGAIEGKSGAAKILDINPQTLKSRMRKLGIQRAKFCTCNEDA